MQRKVIMAKGSYIGGSSIINTGNAGGPARSASPVDVSYAANPRAGGADVALSRARPKQHHRIALPTFRKLRRRCKDTADYAPFLPKGHSRLAARFIAIHQRIEELARLPFSPDVAEEAASLSKEFHTKRAPLLETPEIIHQAKLKKARADRDLKSQSDLHPGPPSRDQGEDLYPEP